MRPLRLLLGLALVPLLTGTLVVTYQDATLTHYPARAVMAQQLRAGEFPFLHPGASCGQPLAGNPNFGAFFPDVLLLLTLPLPVAFGCRFGLVLLLGWMGARRLARAEGFPGSAAEIAATAFVLSGVFLSTWRFFNSGLALAVAPWVMAAAAKLSRTGSRRTAAELGLWGGLEILAGEPVIALLTGLLAAVRSLRAPRRPVVLALALALLIAAPQIAATLQILPDSSRERRPFPFVIAAGTSVHPARLLEQVIPFPFGRPDLRGPDGFHAHALFDGHEPYLWTLSLGLPVVGLLLAFGLPRDRLYLGMAAGALLLAFGRFLPGAKALYPLLSLGGRIRFPIKWWYVVLLCLIPLVARAAARWEEGARPRRVTAGVLLALAMAIVALGPPSTALTLLGPLVSMAVLLGLLVAPRRPGWLAGGLAVSQLACALPLLLAVLDRPPADPPRVGPGRVFSRAVVQAHPKEDTAAGTVRAFLRRAPDELWPLVGAVNGTGYAFDRDPDGAYGDDDRALRKALDALPWPERAATLRTSGVSSVVTNEALPHPYREVAFLNRAEGVRLYALEPAPSVRLATRIFHAADPAGVIAVHNREDFDPRTDAVTPGDGPAPEHTTGARLLSVRERTGRLEAEVEAPQGAVLVWSRSYLSGWWATVDGRPGTTVLADGHLLGIPVPAGRHRVEIGWSRGYVAVGAGLSALGLAGLALLRRG